MVRDPTSPSGISRARGAAITGGSTTSAISARAALCPRALLQRSSSDATRTARAGASSSMSTSSRRKRRLATRRSSTASSTRSTIGAALQEEGRPRTIGACAPADAVGQELLVRAEHDQHEKFRRLSRDNVPTSYADLAALKADSTVRACQWGARTRASRSSRTAVPAGGAWPFLSTRDFANYLPTNAALNNAALDIRSTYDFPGARPNTPMPLARRAAARRDQGARRRQPHRPAARRLRELLSRRAGRAVVAPCRHLGYKDAERDRPRAVLKPGPAAGWSSATPPSSRSASCRTRG